MCARSSAIAHFHRSSPRRLAILRHRFDPSVAAVVRTLPPGVGIRGSDVLAQLEAAGSGTDDARATVRLLLVTGVLRREAAPDGYARNGKELAAQVRASGLEPLAAVVAGLYEEGCARGFATAAPAERRQTVTRLLRASVAGGADAGSEAAGNAYDERNLVFETLWGRPALSPRHLAALRWRLLPALADGLRGTIRVSTAYRTLLGHFIRSFGKGGVCPNLLDWIVRVAELTPGGFAFEEDAAGTGIAEPDCLPHDGGRSARRHRFRESARRVSDDSPLGALADGPLSLTDLPGRHACSAAGCEDICIARGIRASRCRSCPMPTS